MSTPKDGRTQVAPNPSGFDGTLDRVIKVIDQISIWTGKTASWLVIPLAAVLAYEVFIRKIAHPTIWAHDWATQFYGTHFLIPAAWTLYLGKHIRTDMLYEKWSLRTQAWVDLLLYVFLFLPGMLMFFYLCCEYAAESWDLEERLLTPGRPPAYYFKTVLPIGVGLLILQGVAEILKCIRVLRGGRQ